ncbi:MAG: pyridoxamine 5'-phosphate oxidase family protein [Clostridiales bacterium]|nr:pyridoxamine 5'-phosphate oxidase family protein [Clostridiales bacterium]
MNISYDLLEKEVIEFINDNDIWVLATSAKDRVSARSISIVNKGFTIYFQTHEDYLKYKQIRENNKVALCRDNVQIEGMAKIKGNPFAEGNSEFISLYKKQHKSSFDKYTKLDGQVVIEIEPKRIAIWRYVDSVPYIDYLDVENKKAVRKRQKYVQT